MFIVLLHYDSGRRHDFVRTDSIHRAIQQAAGIGPKVGAYENCGHMPSVPVSAALAAMRKRGARKLCKFCIQSAAVRRQEARLPDLLARSIDDARQRKLFRKR